MNQDHRGDWKSRLKYRADNIMSQGMTSKIILLFVVLLFFIIIMGVIATLLLRETGGFTLWSMWETLLSTLDTGNLGALDNQVKPVFLVLMLIATLFGLFFMALLIGLVSDGIAKKMNELAKGRSRVLEQDHTVILGYNDNALIILRELIEANRNQPKKQAVTVLDEMDVSLMGDEIRGRLRNVDGYKNTKIICRKGIIHDFADLEMCSIRSAKSVIINTLSDFDTTKAILACTRIIGEESESTETYAVAVIYEQDNEATALIAGTDRNDGLRVEMLSLQKTLARIIVHTSRQPGLSLVFTEVFSFLGSEFYIIDRDELYPKLYHKSVREINHVLNNAIAIGVWKKERGIVIDAPDKNMFEEGDRLIVLQSDDDPFVLESEAYGADLYDIRDQIRIERNNCMLIGIHRLANDVLCEEVSYLQRGSRIIAVDDNNGKKEISQKTREALLEKGVELVETKLPEGYGKEEIGRLLETYQPESIIVLTNHETDTPEKEDEHSLKMLLYLREYRHFKQAGFRITSEIHMARNQRLVAATGEDDFIISRHMASLLMAQIAQKKEITGLFQELLTSDGYEIYIKECRHYVPTDERMHLYAVIDAVAQRNEIFIGYRRKNAESYDAPVLNPPKRDQSGALLEYTFSEGDFFVVIAEEMRILA